MTYSSRKSELRFADVRVNLNLDVTNLRLIFINNAKYQYEFHVWY